MNLWVGRQSQNSVWVRGGCRLRNELRLLFLLQVCSSLPRPLPLLQWLFQSQETGGEDASSRVDATRPQRRLLLVRLPHDYITPGREPPQARLGPPSLLFLGPSQSMFAFTRPTVTIRWNINHEIIKNVHKNIKTSRQGNESLIHTPRLFSSLVSLTASKMFWCQERYFSEDDSLKWKNVCVVSPQRENPTEQFIFVINQSVRNRRSHRGQPRSLKWWLTAPSVAAGA